MRATSLLLVLATAGLAAACGGKPAPEQPAPEPTAAPARAHARAGRRQRRAATALERDRGGRREASERARAVAADLAAMINFEYDQAAVRATDQAHARPEGRHPRRQPERARCRSAATRTSAARTSTTSPSATGARRAAKRYLENKGIDAARLDVVSYGEERPLNPGHDEAAYAQNRRDEFQVTAGGDNLVAPQ